MAVINAPCQNCKERWVDDKTSCHATCERYKEWKNTTFRERKEEAIRAKLDIDSYSVSDSMQIRKPIKELQRYRRDKK